MSKISILILGGGGMQLPAIKTAAEMGWTTIVADGVRNVPGREYADFFENIDLKDTTGMIKTAFKYKNSTGLNGVFTAGTDFSETVARVAAAVGLPGISIESAINASNKWKMREVFQTHNVPSPAFFTIHKNVSFSCESLARTGLEFPLVVKPVDNMGSRGIRRTDNCKQLESAVKEAFIYSRSGSVIVEEYLEGSEFSIDALVYKNDIIICGFADRNICYPPYFIEMGHTIPSFIDPELSNKIISTFKAAVRALGITEGAAKGDIRLNRGKVYIGEIAARLSGGYMSGWTFPYSSGVPLTREALKIAVGQAPGNLVHQFIKTSAERAFISIPGIIKHISGLKDARSDENINDLFLRVNIGDTVKFPENNVEKAGNFIAVNKNRAIAINSSENACRKVFIRLEASNKNTEEFLFGKFQSWVEDAFSLKEVENIEILKNMPDYWFDNEKRVGIVSLPVLKKESVFEWHGKSIDLAFREVLEQKYSNNIDLKVKSVSFNMISSFKDGKVDIFRDGIGIGRLFYKAFLRGGVQGGVWVIDSILKTIDEKKNLLELFSRWQEY